MTIKRPVAATAAFLALAVAGAEAQQRQHQHCPEGEECRTMQMERQQGGMMMMMMGGIGRFTPEMLIEHRSDLSLTMEQVQRLEAIASAATQAKAAARTVHDTHRRQLMEALSAPMPDLEIVRTHFDAAHAAMGRMHRTQLEAALEAMAVLTEEQRTLVRSWPTPRGRPDSMHGERRPGR